MSELNGKNNGQAVDPLEQVPAELKSLNHWVAWKIEVKDGKSIKVPLNPRNGYNAASNNPDTWGSFEEAVRYFEACKDQGCAGIGYMFSDSDPYSGVDLDKCRNPETGEIEPWAKEIIADVNSYTEISPSGTGVHILVKGELPPGGNRKGHVEMYSQARYFTVTGKHLDGTPISIEDRDAELKALHARIFAKDQDLPAQPDSPQAPELGDDELIARAKQAANGEKFEKLWNGNFADYPSQSEADLALCSFLAFLTNGDALRMDQLFRESGLMRPKWDEPRSSEGKTYGQFTVEFALAGFQEFKGQEKHDYAEEINQILQNLPGLQSIPEKLKHLAKLVPLLAKVSNLEAESVFAELEESHGIKEKSIKALIKDVAQARKQSAAGAQEEAESAPQIILTAGFEGLVELVKDKGSTAFLVLENGALKILREITRDGQTYAPPSISLIPWLLPRAEEVVRIFDAQESAADLYRDLVAYHKGISELPGEEYYDLIAAWVIHTYLLEPVQYSPIIYFYAIPERGKSRTGKGMVYASRRGLHVESLRPSYMFRMAENFLAAFFLDVIDIWAKANQSDSADILLHRYEKGATVPRIMHPDRGPFQDTVFYRIFGPTIIATNVPSPDLLESRSIQINMPLSLETFDIDVTAEMALPLKERLTAFRARYMTQPLPDAPKPVSGRLGDIVRPLVQVIRLVKSEREPALIDLINKLQQDRQAAKTETAEVKILSAIVALRSKVLNGRLAVSDIVNLYNQGKPKNFHISPESMGKTLIALGFKKGRTSTGNAAIVWDEAVINRLCDHFGVVLPVLDIEDLGAAF